MSIVDELAVVIESEVGNTSMAERIAKAVLDHLAAKAGDVRGMLPEPRNIGRIGARTEPNEGESIAEWYIRIGNKVIDLCAERLAPVVWALKAQQSADPDEPIADPAERARAVARILRDRGYHAHVDGAWRVTHLGCKSALNPVWWSRDMRDWVFDAMGPRAIADAIQREEARRAQQWAGDEQPAEGGAHG